MPHPRGLGLFLAWSSNMKTLALRAAAVAAVLCGTASGIVQAGAAPIPMVVGRATGAGEILVYDDAATGTPSAQFTAFANSFNGGVELSSADVDADGVRDLVALHAQFGRWVELRAYSGVDRTLIAADVLDPLPMSDHISGRYWRLLGGDGAAVILGRGGASPELATLAEAGSANARPAIALPASHVSGVNFAIVRVSGPDRDLVVSVPRFGLDTHFRIHDLADGSLVGSHPVMGGDSVSDMAIDVADVVPANPGPEVIVGIAGLTPPKLRVFSLDGTLLHDTNIGSASTFQLRLVAVPSSEAPSGQARIMVLPDGGIAPPFQLYEVQLDPVLVTPISTGFHLGLDGLRGALGRTDGGGLATIHTAPIGGLEPYVQHSTLAFAALGGTFSVFDSGYMGGVHVTSGYLDSTSAPVIVAAPGLGGPPLVRVIEPGAAPRLLRQFMAYPGSVTGGINLATGDLDGDGSDEIITGPASGNVALVRIFNSAGESLNEFLAYAPTFTGGINVAVGDVAEDASAEIIAAPNAPGMATQLVIFRLDGTVITSFQAASAGFDAAVTLAVGDVDSDGRDDIIAAARNSVNTTGVRVFRGGAPSSGDMLLIFPPFAPDETLAVNAGFSGSALGSDLAAPHILVGEGGATTRVRVFNAAGFLVDTLTSFGGASAQGVRPGTSRLRAVNDGIFADSFE
jgi:hypothetical protein